MDADMYQDPATRANVERLRSFGYVVVEPEAGALAPGWWAPAGSLQPGVDRRGPSSGLFSITAAGRAAISPGGRILVTAGGTAEPIDPVRFIGNRSSGGMGAEVAWAALERGASVTLVVGQTSVPLPPDALVVLGADHLSHAHRCPRCQLAGADVLVMTAAVADFQPAGGRRRS